MNTGTRTTVVALAMAFLGHPALAQSMPGSGSQQAGFGRAIAIGGSSVFVGEAQNNTKPGVVHAFQRSIDGSSWTQYAEIQADGGMIGDRFGQSVAASGELLLVGAAGESNAGVVLSFERSGDGGWSQTGALAPASSEEGLLFGSSLSIRGQIAVVGAPGAMERAGAAYVYTRDERTGMWSAGSPIHGSDSEAGDRFGSVVHTDGKNIFVGSPRQNAGDGAVYVYAWDTATSSWTQTAKLAGADVGEGGFFGSAIDTHGPHVLIGAPRAAEGMGAIAVYELGNGAWTLLHTAQPEGTDGGTLFGNAIAVAGNDFIVGVPGANERSGMIAVYRLSGGQLVSSTVAPGDLDSRDGFGGSLAAAGNVLVVGVTGDDFGSGSARIFERSGDSWTEKAVIMGKNDNLMAVSGGRVDCTDGMASDFGCEQVDLLSFVPVQELGGGRGVRVNDVWGWTDPETDREYAIVGRIDGTSFVDITDPNNPVYKGNLPRTEGSPPSTWRDMKTYKNHVFIVADGAGDHGMQVLDLTQLRDIDEPVTFTPTVHYDLIASAHNIVINEETGYAYTVGNSSGGETCGGGLHMINIQDPRNPEFVGCFADPTTGRSGTGYSHDAMCITYNGPDSEHRGQEICFGSNETALSIADVTDKANPVALSTASYPNVGYAHQGWITDDHRFFYLNDELDELSGKTDGTRTMIWDVSDLDDPQLINEYVSANKSSDHNLYIRGNFMYQSNYQSGLRIFDIRDAGNPVPVGFFDTVPYGEDTPGFGGSWSNYPFFKSGSILVTSGSEGLFVVRKRQVDS